MQVTLELLQHMCPKTKTSVLEGYLEPLNTVAEYYEMTANPARLAGFLAQTAHESANFSAVEENLNYSAKALMAFWPKRFAGVAEQYQRHPQMIANRAYCDRMGNGPESSGDGWKYRGRGPIQLTGSANYMAFAKDMFDDWQNLYENPDWVTADKIGRAHV